MGIIGSTGALSSLSETAVLANEVTGTRAEGAGPHSTEDRLAWFRAAKFGMFIHFGAYSLLGGEWRGKQLLLQDQFPPMGLQLTETIMDDFRIPLAEYREEVAGRFNPVNFNAQQWVSVAKAAGAKYLVITAKHQDGFAMWHSKVSKYNIVDATPFKRDPMKELAEACQQQGIRLCFYYSHRDDYEDPNSYGNTWDFHARKRDYAKYWEGKALPQVRELLTGYGPIGLIWFDHGIYTVELAQQMLDLMHSIQPNCLANSRLLVDSYFGRTWPELLGDYDDLGDHQLPSNGSGVYFETLTTTNQNWGFSKLDHDWKSPNEIIRDLVNAVSKGGNYLLDIGPTGDGILPQPAVDVWKKVGEWTGPNGESIYGASAGPFGELPWGCVTVKGEKIYLHVFKLPEDGALLLPGLKNQVKKAYLLLDSSQSLNVHRDQNQIIIPVPNIPPLNEADTVIVLEIVGTPEVEPPVVEVNEHSAILLTPDTAVPAGKAIKYYTRNGGYHISKWKDPQDSVAWHIKIDRPHKYQVWVHYASTAEFRDGMKFQVSIGSATLEATVEDTTLYCFGPGLPCEQGYQYNSRNIGIVDLFKSGPYELRIKPTTAGAEMMYLQWIQLTPLTPLFKNNPSAH